MANTLSIVNQPGPVAASPQILPEARIAIAPLGMGLGSFFSLTFVLCVLFDLWFPTMAMNPVWAPLLPGFSWISWSSFLLGLAETFAYGWYVAVLFGPMYNFFSKRFAQ